MSDPIDAARREAEAAYEAIHADLSPEDRSALLWDRLLYGRSVMERTADGRARRVPPSEWTDRPERGT